MATALLRTRYKLCIQYNGTRYKGWQTQPDDLEKSFRKTSVQSVLENALQKVTGSPTTVYVAGRTDAGVHAIENVAHVDIVREAKSPKHALPSPFGAQVLKMALNGALNTNPDILITNVETVDENFHARFSATKRSYQYRIVSSCTDYGKPFEAKQRWFLHSPLDLVLMRQACDVLRGHHDFTTFRTSGDDSSPERTLEELDVQLEDPSLPFFAFARNIDSPPLQQLTISTRSRSYMTHQVRKMVAAIVKVGSGAMTVDRIKEILEAKNPALCPTMAPAHGLYLTKIEYGTYTILDRSANTQEGMKQHLEEMNKKRATKAAPALPL